MKKNYTKGLPKSPLKDVKCARELEIVVKSIFINVILEDIYRKPPDPSISLILLSLLASDGIASRPRSTTC